LEKLLSQGLDLHDLESGLSKYTRWRQRKRFAITSTDKRRRIGYSGIQTEINIIIRFKHFS